MANYTFSKTDNSSEIYTNTSGFRSYIGETLTPSGLKILQFENGGLITPGYRFVNHGGDIRTPKWVNGVDTTSHYFAEDLESGTSGEYYLGGRNETAEVIIVPPLTNGASDYAYINGAGINDSIIFLQNKAEVASLKYNSLGISLLSTLTGNVMISGVSQFEFLDHALCLGSGSATNNSFWAGYNVAGYSSSYWGSPWRELDNIGTEAYDQYRNLIDNLDNILAYTTYTPYLTSLDFLGGDDLLILSGLRSDTETFISLDTGEWSMFMSDGKTHTFKNL